MLFIDGADVAPLSGIEAAHTAPSPTSLPLSAPPTLRQLVVDGQVDAVVNDSRHTGPCTCSVHWDEGGILVGMIACDVDVGIVVPVAVFVAALTPDR